MRGQSWKQIIERFSPQKWVGILFTLLTMIAFQNCSKVNFNATPLSSAAAAAAAPIVYSYNWASIGYSACSTSCGTGTQAPNLACVRSDGTTVANSYCAGVVNPYAAQACTDNSGCSTPVVPSYTYAWSNYGYSACSTSCGTGTQTPNNSCVRSDGVAVASSYCTQAAPWTVRVCTDNSGCAPPTTTLPPAPVYTYAWAVNSYGSCSNTCGAGTQAPNNSCVRNDGTVVASSLCTAPAPAAIACSDTSGCPSPTTTTFPSYTYSCSWVTSSFSACSTTCGSGVQYPNSSCVRSDGAVVANTLCPAPPSPVACSDTSGCAPVYTYNWSVVSYTACSTTCGSGVEYPNLSCVRSDGASVDNSNCGGALPGAIACSDNSGCAPQTTTTQPPPVTTLPAPVITYVTEISNPSANGGWIVIDTSTTPYGSPSCYSPGNDGYYYYFIGKAGNPAGCR